MGIERDLYNHFGIERTTGNYPLFRNGFSGGGMGRGKTFYVSAESGVGSDNNDGLSPFTPLATLAAAYALTTDNRNDTVALIGGPTAHAVTSALTWSKSFTHLIGISADLPGVGQRTRVTAGASDDLTELVTFSGNGCIVRNVQFYNGADANVDSGAVVVSGDRNYFENCFIVGMQHATPAARAGSYSLTVSGEENAFVSCAIGADTIIRAAANAELILASGATRNLFQHCRFQSYSETAGKFLVNVAAGVDRWQEFEDCVFYNFWTNWTDNLDNAFDIDVSATHAIVLRGSNQLVGVDGWADTVTHLYATQPAPGAGFGVNTAPTT